MPDQLVGVVPPEVVRRRRHERLDAGVPKQRHVVDDPRRTRLEHPGDHRDPAARRLDGDLADLAADAVAQARTFAVRAQHENPVHPALNLVLDQPSHPGPVEALVRVERRHRRWNDPMKASLTPCCCTSHASHAVTDTKMA